jgi:endoglucanase
MRLLVIVLVVMSLVGCPSKADNTASTNPAPNGSGITPQVKPQDKPQVTGDIRLDHFGWRPADRKTAILLGHGGERVELRRAADNSVVTTYTASGTMRDEDSQDDVATVDLTAQQTPGTYYLYLPSIDRRSYEFDISSTVYNIVGAAAMKSFYFQRCNHDKVMPYASDALLGYPGSGSRWVDKVCHLGDAALSAGPGSADHGVLSELGGWHDAGDYQKTLWDRGVPSMLFAYEINPSVWYDKQLNLPESGDGLPDILDELAWELDFYVRMQRTDPTNAANPTGDGHFMTSVKGHLATTKSPPSASDEKRVYFDSTSPANAEWSGGGVTIATATGNAVLSLAHAAIVFRQVGAISAADGYAAAATKGWTWLSAQNLTGNEARLRAAAAAAVYRLDPTNTSAKTLVEAFPWATWDGTAGSSATPGDNVLAMGAWHILANSNASTTLKDAVRKGVLAALVEPAFQQEGAYGGMLGGPGNGWNYSWGSNRSQSMYGANLMLAAHFGVVGSHSVAEVVNHGQQYFHYITGLNPLNMVYLTNMATYGGEHSSFQMYHSWFSWTGNDGDHGNVDYNGKPTWVNEPLYPYYPSDSQTSKYGPAPGLMPGGPNFYYSCSYDIPNRNNPAYAYRDFSVGCDWNGAKCRACAWEISEPMDSYQGPFVLLASFMMTAP